MTEHSLPEQSYSRALERIQQLEKAAADVVAAWDNTAGPDQREWFPWLYSAIQNLRKKTGL